MDDIATKTKNLAQKKYLLRVLGVNPGVRARMLAIFVTRTAISKPSLNESSLHECVSIWSE